MGGIDYDLLLAEHGDSPKALGWSAEGQQKRFKVLAEFCEKVKTTSILDVGCGLSHFREYCSDGDRFPAFRKYLGVDSSPAFIRRSKSKWFPNGTTEFMCLDVLKEGAELPKCDVAVSSGMLNIETGTNYEDMHRLIRRMFDASSKGCAVNMLSDNSLSRTKDRHYYDPIGMLSWVFEKTTSMVTLRHDYLHNDFTLYLFKDAS